MTEPHDRPTLPPAEAIAEFRRMADIAEALPEELGELAQARFIVAITVAQEVIDRQWEPRQGYDVCYRRLNAICRDRERRLRLKAAIQGAEVLAVDARAAAARCYEAMQRDGAVHAGGR